MKGLPNCLVWCHKPPKQRFVSTWSQIWPQSVEISIDCSIASAPSNTPPHPRLRPCQQRFILFILLIRLAIATILKRVFDLETCDFGGFNNVFNVLNKENKLELECDLRDVLSSPTSHTIVAADTATIPFNFGGLEYVFDVIFNEYKINNEINDIYFNENFYVTGIVNAYYYALPGALLSHAPNIMDIIIVVDILKGEEKKETGVPLIITICNIVFKFFQKEREVGYEFDYDTQAPISVPEPAPTTTSAPTLATIITNNNDKNLGALLASSTQTFEKEVRKGFEALLSAIDTANDNFIRGLFAALFSAINAAITGVLAVLAGIFSTFIAIEETIIGIFTGELAAVLSIFISKILRLLGYAIAANVAVCLPNFIAPIDGAYTANIT